MKELKIGNRFNPLANWRSVIDGILIRDKNKALAVCHEDDGLRKYVIFELKDDEWVSSYSSIYLESMNEIYRTI